MLVEEPEREAEEMPDGVNHQGCREEEQKEEELGRSVEIMVKEEEEQVEKAETEKEDSECVISDQPVSHGDKPVSQTPEVPPSSLPGLRVPCCQGSTSPDEGKDEEAEPNNNTNKPAPPVLPESPVPSIPASSARLILNKKEAQKTGREGEQDEKTEELGGRDDLVTDKCQPHNALGTRDDAAQKVEQGKRHSIKLRERLFQFPLCEKALAFNIPTHNKPKILPLAQYNCCHVL